MYRAARARVQRLVTELERHHPEKDDARALREIESASDQIDRNFETRILPAVRSGDRVAARAAHDKGLSEVLLVQDRTDRLAKESEGAIAAFEARVGRVQKRTYVWAASLLAAAIAFAILVGLWIVRSVTRPVAALEAGAAKLARGDLDTRIQVYRDDELGRLAAQFNAMTASLKAHQAELLKSERLAGIGRLAAGVAHEINNPLGVILGYTKLLRKKADPAACEDLDVIEEETLRCKEIVEGLLDLSRPWDPGADPVDLEAVCEQAASRLAESGKTGGAAIEVHGAARAIASPRAVHQMVANLLRNGVEASGDGGRVTVTVENGSAEARVVVDDTGPGITEAAQGRLFEPFFTTKDGGTGLGLAVSQAIARAHGGRIEAGNREGGGARFVLVLPAAPAPTGDEA